MHNCKKLARRVVARSPVKSQNWSVERSLSRETRLALGLCSLVLCSLAGADSL